MNLFDFVTSQGDEFTNPMLLVDLDLEDQPIIYANREFQKLTQYRAEQILGKNCRFLQGSGTDQEARKRVREAIQDRRPICQDLLNYKKDGTPFYNRLVLIPLSHNNKNYFVGLQNEIPPSLFKESHDVHSLTILDQMINPITAILSTTYLLSEATNGESKDELKRKLYQNFDRIDQTIKSF